MTQSDLVVRARRLRRDQTEAEARLWRALRDGQLNGIGFRRQHPVAGFVVDFYAPQQKLIVELDGGQHDEPEQRVFDEKRTQILQQQGHRVIRFWNNEVFENLDGVLEEIWRAASNLPSP
jgi:very-short-patch-repair endonuclease